MWVEDAALRKLETYRLYKAGYAVAGIAEAFGFAPGYLYEMWGKFKAEGTEALLDGLGQCNVEEALQGMRVEQASARYRDEQLKRILTLLPAWGYCTSAISMTSIDGRRCNGPIRSLC